MAIARVTAHDGVGSTAATFGGTPTAGNLLLCTVYSVGAATISGWTSIVSQSDGSGILTLLAKISAGSEGTITPSSVFTVGTTVCEYSGAAATLQQDGTAAGTTTPGATSRVSAAITTTETTSLIFLCGSIGNATTNHAWSGGPTLLLSNVANATVNGQYLPAATVSSFTSTLSWTTSSACNVLIAGFKAGVPFAARNNPLPMQAVQRAATR